MFLPFLVIEVASGHLSGFQKIIMDKNTQVVFVSCDNHILNMFGGHCDSQE